MNNYQQLTMIIDEIKNDDRSIEDFKIVAEKNLVNSSKQVKVILEEAVDVFKNKDNLKGQGWAMAMLGRYYHYNSSIEKQIKYQVEAGKVFYDIKDKDGLIYVFNGLMSGYFQLGLNELSVKCGIEALKLAEETNNQHYIVVVLTNMCINYLKNNDYEEAKKTIEFLYTMPNIEKNDLKITIHEMMAEIECEGGDYKKGLKLANEAINMSISNKLEVMTLEGYRIRAKLNAKLGNMDMAEEDYNYSLNISRKGEYRECEGWILLSWAQSNIDNGQYEIGINKLLSALNISEEINMRVLLKSVYEELYKVYKLQGKFKESLDYYERFIKLKEFLESKSNKMPYLDLKEEVNKQMEAIFKSLYDDITVISNIGQKITADLNINRIVENIYNEICMLMDTDVVGITQLIKDENSLDYTLFMEQGNKLNMDKVSVDNKNSIGAYCVRNRVTILIDDIYVEYPKYVEKLSLNKVSSKVHSMLYCPLILENDIKGFLCVKSYKKNAYTIKELNKLTVLASYVAIAIENSYLYNKAKYYAAYDYLTGLLTRKEIFTQGETSYKLCSKNNGITTFLMIDIDNFKMINDCFGHDIGDRVLKEIGNIINSNVKNKGICGRYGGEEFLVILPKIKEENACIIGENILKNIQNAKIYLNEKKTIRVTVSIGIFFAGGKETSFDQCIKFADEALYIAKAEGKNKIVQYENFN